jgi:hypothetical protein
MQMSEPPPDDPNGVITIPVHRLSDLLAAMLADSEGQVSVGQALESLGRRSYGGVMIVMALPAMLLPPGVALILAAPLSLVALQLLVSRSRPWVPAEVCRRSLPRADAEKLFGQARPIMRFTEAWLRPRLLVLMRPVHYRLVAGGAFAMSVVLMTPLPIAHTAAALSIAAFGAGLMERDGAALLLGWGLAVVSLAVAAALIFGAAVWLHGL